MEVNVEVSEKPDRHVPDWRRLLLGRRTSSSRRRSRRTTCFGRGQSLSRAGAAVAPAAAVPAVVHRACTSSTPRWTFGFDLFNQFQYYPSFQRKTHGGSLTWGYMLVDDLHLYLRYTLRTSRSPDRRPHGVPLGRPAHAVPARHPGQPAAPRVDLVGARSRSRTTPATTACSPTAVGSTRPRAEIAEPFLLGRRPASPATTRPAGYFYPIWGPFVLRLKAQLGLVTSRDPQGVPIFERYFVGGIYDVRGFRPYSLGPRIRAPDQQTPDALLNDRTIGGNLQVVDQGRDRVPDHRKGRDPGGLVRRRGQRLQPGRPVLPPCGRPTRTRPSIPASNSTSSRISRPCAAAGASDSAGSRPSARCASSGACRSAPAGRRAHDLRVHHRQRSLISPNTWLALRPPGRASPPWGGAAGCRSGSTHRFRRVIEGAFSKT